MGEKEGKTGRFLNRKSKVRGGEKKRVNSGADNNNEKKKQRREKMMDLTLLDESLLARLDVLVDLFSEVLLEREDVTVPL